MEYLPMNWEILKLSKVLKIKHGKNQKQVECDKGRHPILGSGGLMGYANDYLWDKPSVLIGRKGTINKPQFMEKPFWTVDTLFYTHIFEGYEPKWLFYVFQTINWLKYNEASGVPSLSSSTIEAIKILVPPLEEQKKIAKILSTWDREIELKKQKYDKFMMYKKTLINMIFGDFKDWNSFKLSNLCKIVTGKKDSNEMNENGPYKFFTCAKQDYLIDHYAFDTEALLIAGNGDIGHIKYYNGKFNAYQRTYVLYNFKESIFYVKAFMDYKFSNQVKKEKQMGAMPYIKLGTLSNFKIPIPDTKTKQFIVDIINLLNIKEKLLILEIENLKLQKKGLMQQLLTGKIRVKV
jgi:type I restriction enzyme S subunit